MPAANPAYPAFEQLTWAAASARCTGEYSGRSGNWALCAGEGYDKGRLLLMPDAGMDSDKWMWPSDAYLGEYNCKGMGCGCELTPRCSSAACAPQATRMLTPLAHTTCSHRMHTRVAQTIASGCGPTSSAIHRCRHRRRRHRPLCSRRPRRPRHRHSQAASWPQSPSCVRR